MTVFHVLSGIVAISPDILVLIIVWIVRIFRSLLSGNVISLSIATISLYTADCSVALQDSNCEECGFDSNNMPICTTCRVGYRVINGQCANEGMYVLSGFNHRSVIWGIYKILHVSPFFTFVVYHRMIHCDIVITLLHYMQFSALA